MKENKIKPIKSMGQNFLIDANICDKIVKRSGLNSTDNVLEVGAGQGVLTTRLAEKVNHVTAIELDKRLIKELENILLKYKNVTLIQENILKINIKKIIEESLNLSNWHVCANLPYNITTPIITTFIEADIFKTITIMIQKEVAERICAKPGTPDYSAFTIYTNYHTTPEKLFDVPPECFSPRPKVMSSVVKMIVRDKKPLNTEEEKLFFKIVRAAFAQRRKTLVNALHAVFAEKYNKEEIIEAIKNCGFDTNIRGERLSIEDFVHLCNYLQNIVIAG
ncbi:MAG: 16S rRNA (adenine(1518)-N(6)/adenine(1519)-N(6))-dimethyltransferase RsmA [Oscillospiraceae bacterium]|jgi:16S rRNA (adenine1518-N6/adenine1519-N6)-dimethyltransferase|nr:16S rRNA (adenine(1518)-N(6)/adenine(1519)-N(6))-dimethyltransferase RsmA [Oscillospiraceae bacterium]